MFLFFPKQRSLYCLIMMRFILLSLCIAVSSAWSLELTDKLFSYIEQKYGKPALDRMQAWQALLKTEKKTSINVKLEQVNRFFNQANFVSDLKHWGKKDYWATPVELLATNGGDCEDYSIAKYYTLRELGVPDDKMRITYVKALTLNQAHMVLAYYEHPEDEPLILDNLINTIKPASQRTDLYPVYSFNADGLWLSKQAGNGKRIGQSKKLSRWVELNKRLQSELNPEK